MKKTLLIFLLILAVNLQAQESTLKIIPEFSVGRPIGAFGEDAFNTENGFGAGLHLEKQNIWKVFGLGLYAGYHTYATDYSSPFDNQINDDNFSSRLFVDGTNLDWKSVQLAIGPTLNFNLIKKVQIQGFTKVGFAKVSYPEYRYYAAVTNPVNEEFTLFEANTPSDAQSDFNFMMTSGLRINYQFSKRFGMHIGANFTHIKGLTHTYTARDVQLTGEEMSGEIYETLLNTPEITKSYECNINTVNNTIGITISLGGGSKPDNKPQEDPEEPISENAPEEEYNCGEIIYESPGYNGYVVLNKAPYAIFQWTDENTRGVKDDKSYQLIFFIKENGGYKEVEKHIMNSKRRFKKAINPKQSYPDNALYWKIIPLDAGENQFCPETSRLMRLLVFKNPEEALKLLPECLTQVDENKPTDTNFFKEPNKN